MAKILTRSISNSQETPIECKIQGTIPQWIHGTLFRNGPGRFRFNEKVYDHIFDGCACINKFQIKNGKVYYTNKILETSVFQKATKTNKLSPIFSTGDPTTGVIDRVKFLMSDNVNVNVVPFSKTQLYALTETAMMVQIDPKNLSILSKSNLISHLKSTMTAIAHPHIEEDGSWLSIGMKPITLGLRPHYSIIKYDASKGTNLYDSVRVFSSIPSSHNFDLSYIHSFGLSKNYIIFLEQSLILDFKKVIWNIFTNQPLSETLVMNPNFETRIHLVDRKTGQLMPLKFYTIPQFTYHYINTFELNEHDPTKHELVIDVCSYRPSDFRLDTFNYNESDVTQIIDFFDKSKSYPRRIRVPLYDQKAKKEKVFCEINDICSNINMELPTINYFKYNGKPYNFAYGVASVEYSIVKINVNNLDDYKEAVMKNGNSVIAPSEPIFVERPNAESEDDGVLLTIVLGDSYDSLVVLDAKTMLELGRAELPCDVKATFTFHGFFADDKTFHELN